MPKQEMNRIKSNKTAAAVTLWLVLNQFIDSAHFWAQCWRSTSDKQATSTRYLGRAIVWFATSISLLTFYIANTSQYTRRALDRLWIIALACEHVLFTSLGIVLDVAKAWPFHHKDTWFFHMTGLLLSKASVK